MARQCGFQVNSAIPRGLRHLFPFMPRRRDRITPVLAEATRRDANSDRGLASLVFVYFDEAHDFADMFRHKTLSNDFRWAQVALDVSLEDGVKDIVRRQRVLVGLIRTKLRRGC